METVHIAAHHTTHRADSMTSHSHDTSAWFDPDLDIVRFSATGRVPPETFRNEISLVIDLVERHGCSRWLSDYSGADVGDLSMLDLHRIAVDQTSPGIPRHVRLAIVPAASERGARLASFDVALSNLEGWEARAFETTQEAIDWLTGA